MTGDELDVTGSGTSTLRAALRPLGGAAFGVVPALLLLPALPYPLAGAMALIGWCIVTRGRPPAALARVVGEALTRAPAATGAARPRGPAPVVPSLATAEPIRLPPPAPPRLPPTAHTPFVVEEERDGGVHDLGASADAAPVVAPTEAAALTTDFDGPSVRHMRWGWLAAAVLLAARFLGLTEAPVEGPVIAGALGGWVGVWSLSAFPAPRDGGESRGLPLWLATVAALAVIVPLVYLGDDPVALARSLVAGGAVGLLVGEVLAHRLGRTTEGSQAAAGEAAEAIAVAAYLPLALLG